MGDWGFWSWLAFSLAVAGIFVTAVIVFVVWGKDDE